MMSTLAVALWSNVVGQDGVPSPGGGIEHGSVELEPSGMGTGKEAWLHPQHCGVRCKSWP